MQEAATERWLTVKGWSRELGIAIEVLEERLKFVRAFPGRASDGKQLLSYCEDDVRRLCADLLNKPREDAGPQAGDTKT